MGFDFAAVKTSARREVHKTFGVRALYTPPGGGNITELSARLHTRIQVGGDGGNAGYATIIEGVTRIVFNREQLADKGLVLRKNGRIEFPDYGSNFVLDIRDTYAGKITEKWSVSER